MLKLIIKKPKALVYEVGSLAEVSNGAITKLPWTDEMYGVVLRLPGTGCTIEDVLGKKLPDYNCSMELYAYRNDIPGAAPVRKGVKIRALPVKSPRERHCLFLRTYSEHFWGRWPEYTDGVALRLIADYLDQLLPASRAVKFMKGDSLAGLLIYHRRKVASSADVHSISWIYISAELSANERAFIHNKVRSLLRSLDTDRVGCFVQTYNLRSQAFFKKLGFKPVALHITRRPS